MLSKKKYYSLLHNTETSQTDFVCKSVEWLLYNRQTLQGKGLIITSVISTYLQLVHVHSISCQFLVSLALRHSAFGSFLTESGTWFQRAVARKTKELVPHFETMTLGNLSHPEIVILLSLRENFIHKNEILPPVVLYTSVSRVIMMFLMWMVVLLSSSTSLSRFKFGLLYTIRRTLFWIWFILFCSVLLQNIQTRQ